MSENEVEKETEVEGQDSNSVFQGRRRSGFHRYHVERPIILYCRHLGD